MRWWWLVRGFVKDSFDEKKRFDPYTYSGLLRSLIVSGLFFWAGWHMDYFFAHLGVKGYENGIPPKNQEWHRLVIIFILALGYVVALIAAIRIFVRRRKVKKSINTQGQWYDTPGLTKDDLYDESSETAGNPESSNREE